MTGEKNPIEPQIQEDEEMLHLTNQLKGAAWAFACVQRNRRATRGAKRSALEQLKAAAIAYDVGLQKNLRAVIARAKKNETRQDCTPREICTARIGGGR